MYILSCVILWKHLKVVSLDNWWPGKLCNLFYHEKTKQILAQRLKYKGDESFKYLKSHLSWGLQYASFWVSYMWYIKICTNMMSSYAQHSSSQECFPHRNFVFGWALAWLSQKFQSSPPWPLYMVNAGNSPVWANSPGLFCPGSCSSRAAELCSLGACAAVLRPQFPVYLAVLGYYCFHMDSSNSTLFLIFM